MHLFCKTNSLVNSIIAIACTALIACTPSSGDVNHTYAQRLENVLKTDSFKLSKPSTLNVKHFAYDNDEKATIGMLELAQLRQCKLSTLIAEHNNQLGKTATPANILSYQIKFLQSANECLESFEKQDELFEKIKLTAAQKQANLPNYFKAMLLNESEFKQSWQLSSTFIDENSAGFSETVSAMELIAKLNNKINTGRINEIDPEQIISQLEVLNRFKYNKLLISAARAQTHYNQQLTQQLMQYSKDDLCPANKNKQKAQTLSNVFKKFYLEQLQPYQSFLVGRLETLQPLYHQIWRDTEMDHFVDSESNDAILHRLKQSAKSHVSWWQDFYRACEISPL
ncbi:MAG: hypothetical protein CMK65_16850 [Pseudoalteromonas sp.]|uniref:DUF3080 family protein n=1 Tax=Pseudoalteromonas sp. TaxID=53249 RepID=UPI000C89A82C|nr:DUF3080 family protein [Pseudoalteromonas sp.]MAD05271.1 hypothetical protein [Pseudoalteromonas sp.]|tara:strand:+ start:29652 stop:30671 length:1020 start_codon:yes stop_codon:yes gene_type:complete